MEALQNLSSGSSADTNQDEELQKTTAELQALEREIEEMKESLANGMSGLASSIDNAQARSSLPDNFALPVGEFRMQTDVTGFRSRSFSRHGERTA